MSMELSNLIRDLLLVRTLSLPTTWIECHNFANKLIMNESNLQLMANFFIAFRWKWMECPLRRRQNPLGKPIKTDNIPSG